MLDMNSVIERDKDIMSAEAGDDIVMVSITKGYYYGVSDVSRTIWQLIDQPIKISEIVDNLIAAYDIDIDQCKEQTLSFLNELSDEGLIQATNESNS